MPDKKIITWLWNPTNTYKKNLGKEQSNVKNDMQAQGEQGQGHNTAPWIKNITPSINGRTRRVWSIRRIIPVRSICWAWSVTGTFWSPHYHQISCVNRIVRILPNQCISIWKAHLKLITAVLYSRNISRLNFTPMLYHKGWAIKQISNQGLSQADFHVEFWWLNVFWERNFGEKDTSHEHKRSIKQERGPFGAYLQIEVSNRRICRCATAVLKEQQSKQDTNSSGNLSCTLAHAWSRRFKQKQHRVYWF